VVQTSRSGKKTISLGEGDHAKIKSIAERNQMDIQDAVVYAFQKTFPGDFPEKIVM
jgi:hypothetical protein